MPPSTKKKAPLYGHIIQWVEAKDPDFAAAIRDLCLEHALGGRSGATLLFPSADVRRGIVEKAYSDEAEAAIHLIEAHVVPMPLRAPADFREAGSRRGVKFAVERADGMTVTLAGGAVLAPAKDFATARKESLAVWVVSAGEVPLTGDKFTPPAAGRARLARGKAKAAPPPVKFGARVALAATVEGEYCACMAADRCATSDPYLARTVSLLNFLRDSHGELLEAVLPILDRDPATCFYLLVEPFKTAGHDFVLPDAVLFGGGAWNAAAVYQNIVSEFQSFFGAAPLPGASQDRSAAKAFSDPAFVRSAVDMVRVNILETGNKTTAPVAIRDVYDVLGATNEISGAGPILPVATLALVSGAKKLWQDELRFVLHDKFNQLRFAPVFSRVAFAEVVDWLRVFRPGNDYAAEARLTNGASMVGNVDPKAEFALLKQFVSSTDFLYIPVPADLIGADQWDENPDIPLSAVMTGGASAAGSSECPVFNAEASKHRLAVEYLAKGFDATSRLSGGCLAAIRHYVRVNGALPAELLGPEPADN